MIKKIRRAEEPKSKFRKEGKVKQLNEQHHIQAIEKMNEHMQQVRQEFELKDINSQISAAEVILNA